MIYIVSQRHYFREISRIVPAGGQVELDETVAAKYMAQWPGLLKPERMTTQGAPEVVRTRSVRRVPKSPSKRKGK